MHAYPGYYNDILGNIVIAMEKIKADSLFNSRLVATLFLGFASGLPLTLTSTTLQAWLTQSNVSLMQIGSISLLGWPYIFKFLWAPLMDQFKLPFFGKRKGWIIITQFILSLSIFALANVNPSENLSFLFSMAVMVAVFSASQDIAIDAYRTNVLQSPERGLGATYFVFAYRMGMLVAGGLALIFADHIGWKYTYEIMAGLILLSLVPTMMAPPVEDISHESNNILQTTWASLANILQRPGIVWLLLLILFYKFGDALALQLMTNFLLHGLGFTLTQIGMAYKMLGFIAIFLGGFAGGVFLLRLSLYHALLYFGLAQAVSNLSFVFLAMLGKNLSFMAFSIFLENFCSGMSTAAFFAFLMSLCDRRYTASQYAFFVGIASTGRWLLGPVAAYMVDHVGWVQFFWWAFVLCFPGIFFLTLLKDRVMEHVHATAN